jgi:dimethylglycine dehydrogenase
MQTQARVVVIGGGMMGAGLLYHLAQEGWTDCLLIEKGELTSGSTWHAAGLCASFIADFNMAKIHDYGVRLYPRLEELTGQYVGWHGCSGIRFATTPQEVEWFHHVAGVAKLIGFRMEVIDPEKIKQINPFVTTEGVLAGAWTLDDGHVDPAGCCNALAKGARDMGASIILRNRVTDIKQRPGGEWEVVTEQGNVVCEHLVNAAGCYARQISRMAGTDAPIINMEHSYIVTEPIKEFIERDEEMPVMRDPYASAYFRQEQKAGMIGIYETANSQECWTHRGGWPEWDSESELFSGDLDRIGPFVERVLERMPIWAESGIKRIVAGAIPHTPDNNPLVGPAPGLRNFWQCCGSAIGIAQGAGCGKYLAQWMVHGDAEINMAGLDPRRLGGHAPGDYTKAKAHEDYEHMYDLHLPGEERPAARKVRVTPLYDKLAARGAVHTAANGWERPKWFSLDGREEEPGFRHNNVFEVVAGECRAVRERVGLLDLSSFAKYDVTGADAEAYLNRICANRMPRREGGIALAHFLSGEGRIAGEATITKLGEGRFYVLSGAAAEDRDLDHLSRGIRDGEDVRVANITDDWGVLVLAGPKSRALLAKLTAAELGSETFRWLTGKEIEVAGVPLRALRVNYVGELGWELHCSMDRLAELYDAVWSAGEAFGIANFGVYAVNSLRMEKAYKGWGAELTNEITMIEADMERFVAYDKEDFLGKAATLRVKQAGVTTQLVYLEVEPGDCDVHGGEPVISNGKVVGVTTSGGYGHATGKSLGFAYVEPALAAPGSAFQIDLLGAPRAATVLAEPIYDPKNERLRA